MGWENGNCTSGRLAGMTTKMTETELCAETVLKKAGNRWRLKEQQEQPQMVGEEESESSAWRALGQKAPPRGAEEAGACPQLLAGSVARQLGQQAAGTPAVRLQLSQRGKLSLFL